ncbi:MAG TPA: hypothetical protein VML53_07660 [Thermoplasmata archaeon]|nr:hypothetical protein [Thermoplasmata archaeon]
MPLDLWDHSTEDVKERWRDIARALRDRGDAEAVPRALQTCFWFGVQAVLSAGRPASELSLLNLLPHDLAAQIAKPPTER